MYRNTKAYSFRLGYYARVSFSGVEKNWRKKIGYENER